MDLRKGSGLGQDKRLCIRCRGRKQLYKTMSGWCFDNSGGTLTDCPMCAGKGIIDKVMPAELTESKELKDAKKRTSRKIKETKQDKIILPHCEKEY